MAPKFTFIHSNAQLAKSAQGLKAYAEMAWRAKPDATTGPGDYSKTEGEAIANAEKLVESGDDTAFANSRWFLFMPMKMPVTVMLTIDATPTGPVWHMSMSTPRPDKGTAGRTPEMFAVRVLQAFFGKNATVVEGPPEGVFEKVRHFRVPYSGIAESTLRGLETAGSS